MKMRTIHATAAAEQLWRSTRGGHSPSIETLKRMLFAGIALALLATAAPADAAAKTRDECTPPVVSVLDVKPVPDKIDEAPAATPAKGTATSGGAAAAPATGAVAAAPPHVFALGDKVDFVLDNLADLLKDAAC